MQARLAGQKTLPKFAHSIRDIVLEDADAEVKASLMSKSILRKP